MALKFMDARKRNVKEAVKMMQYYMEWLQTMPVPETEVIDYLV